MMIKGAHEHQSGEHVDAQASACVPAHACARKLPFYSECCLQHMHTPHVQLAGDGVALYQRFVLACFSVFVYGLQLLQLGVVSTPCGPYTKGIIHCLYSTALLYVAALFVSTAFFICIVYTCRCIIDIADIDQPHAHDWT